MDKILDGYIFDIDENYFHAELKNRSNDIKFELKCAISTIAEEERHFISLGQILSLDTETKKITFKDEKPYTKEELAEIKKRAEDWYEYFKHNST